MAEHAAELQTVSTEFERRSRAILVADVAGYSRLMERAETETHKRYRAIRVGLIDPVIIAQRGELIKNTGDGFVAVFESPSDALRCAVILQREIQVIERETPLAHRIGFRMGINWGPVIFDLDDVYGHGVNVAARLQVAAPSGGIVVSHALLHLAERPNGFDFEDLGELHLKNMSKTVHALSLILPGVDRSAPQGSYDREAGWAKVPTIAVLPFTNLSEHGESYFSEGLVEDIIASLANIRELLVVSRGSSLMFYRVTSVLVVDAQQQLVGALNSNDLMRAKVI